MYSGPKLVVWYDSMTKDVFQSWEGTDNLVHFKTKKQQKLENWHNFHFSETLREGLVFCPPSPSSDIYGVITYAKDIFFNVNYLF